jgi:hypothetical protein
MSQENTAEVLPVAEHQQQEVVEASLSEQFDLPMSDDDFLSEEESAAIIQAHNDALDGVVAKPDEAQDETVVSDAEGNVESSESLDAAEVATDVQAQLDQAMEKGSDAAPEPFDGYSSAREFMSNGASISGLVEKLSKPPVKSLQNQVEAAMDSSAPQQMADDRMQLSLGKAAMLTGAYGLAKLSKMLSGGADLIAEPIHAWQMKGAEKKLGEAIQSMDSRLDSFRSQGLFELDNGDLPLSERQEMARQFFAQPGNKAMLNDLFDSVNGLRRQARQLIEKSIDRGESPDEAANRALEPIKRFADSNEKFLESLKMGDQTLLEKVDNVMNSLFEMLKQMFARMAQMLGVGANKSAEPRLG